MKKIMALILTAIFLTSLTACGHSSLQEAAVPKEDESDISELLAAIPVPAENAFRFTKENFPVLAGDSVLERLGIAAASVLLGESRENAAELIEFESTARAVNSMISGSSEAILVMESSDERIREADSKMLFHQEPFAKEGLVFVVNADNPVDSLTVDQVRDIYAGNITNWNQVGGSDLPISAFQWNPWSNAQMMMEKLVMGDTPMIEPLKEYWSEYYTEEIKATVKYCDNSANAIGYTLYSNAAQMQNVLGMKLLRIDGIVPDAASIRNEIYPFVGNYNCCIPLMTPSEAPAHLFMNWLQSETGQRLLEHEGYVPIYEKGERIGTGTDITVDFSNFLDESEVHARYTLPEGGLSEQMIPSNQYGKIYPYIGSVQYGDTSGFRTNDMTGFYSSNGVLLTKPVYCNVYSVDNLKGDDCIWVCGRIADDGQTVRYQLLASDGRKITDTEYGNVEVFDRYFVARDKPDGDIFDIYSREDFRLCGNQETFVYLGEHMRVSEVIGEEFCTYRDGKRYVMDVRGTLIAGPADWITPADGGKWFVLTNDGAYSMVDRAGNVFNLEGETQFALIAPIPPTEKIFDLETFNGGRILADTEGRVIARDYQLLETTFDDHAHIVWDDHTEVYDQNGIWLFNVDKESGFHAYWSNNLVYKETEDGLLIRNGVTGKEVFAKGAQRIVDANRFIDNTVIKKGQPVVFLCDLNETVGYGLTEDMELIPCDPRICHGTADFTDKQTGKMYYMASDSYTWNSQKTIYAEDLTTVLFRVKGSVSFGNNGVTVLSRNAFTCYDWNGNVLFQYPVLSMHGE